MKKARFSEEQIVGILKQHEAGMKTADLCRQHNISAARFYASKAKYGGLEVNEAQELKQVERRELEAEAGGGRPDSGQRGVERSGIKKLVERACGQ
jgi:hypothetical protein